ncbi:unknown protein [Simkania negevensis Z]|uniref:Uncharacterized protein n=1 Tax=Simkania negevensis (strain ATCC VR-1471 / DSM 27360 / Z) TaxID=331113 RepID=F8L3D9_SIMNZ|nr:unknown protein [Simkania negevensis Z]
MIGVTFANPLKRQEKPFENTVFFEGQNTIFRTGRVKTTAVSHERANHELIEANKTDDEEFHTKFPCFVSGIFGIILSSSLLRKWWNWQTRYLEVVVREIAWGFKSPLSQDFLTQAISTWVFFIHEGKRDQKMGGLRLEPLKGALLTEKHKGMTL